MAHLQSSRPRGHFPTLFMVEVGEPTQPGVDRFGREIPSTTESTSWTRVKVVGWEKSQGEEKNDGNDELRLVDTLVIHWPQCTVPPPQSLVRLIDGKEKSHDDVWRVHGQPDDHNYGPWWAPGVVAVQCRRVIG